MDSIFIEIFDVKVLYAIYPMVDISKQYGILFTLKLRKSKVNGFFLLTFL